jgi:hypothetical protein
VNVAFACAYSGTQILNMPKNSNRDGLADPHV